MHSSALESASESIMSLSGGLRQKMPEPLLEIYPAGTLQTEFNGCNGVFQCFRIFTGLISTDLISLL